MRRCEQIRSQVLRIGGRIYFLRGKSFALIIYLKQNLENTKKLGGNFLRIPLCYQPACEHTHTVQIKNVLRQIQKAPRI